MVVALEVRAEVAPQVLPDSDVKRRAQVARPKLQIADLVPAEALPRCQVDQGEVGVEGYKI